MQTPHNFLAPRMEVLTQFSITEPDGVALLMDMSLGSLPDLGWGAISLKELIKPDVFVTTLGGAPIEYVPAAQLSGTCPACGHGLLLLGMTRRRRWFGLRESLADVIHCHSCGAYSKLQSGVAIMVVYYGRGLNQLEWLGRKTDVANVREYMEKMGLPLPEVLASPLRGSE